MGTPSEERLTGVLARHDRLVLAAAAAVRAWGATRRDLSMPLSEMDPPGLAAATALSRLAREGARLGADGSPLWTAVEALRDAEVACERLFSEARQRARDDYDFSAMTPFERGVENADHSDLFSLRSDVSAAEMRRRAARGALGAAFWGALQEGEPPGGDPGVALAPLLLAPRQERGELSGVALPEEASSPGLQATPPRVLPREKLSPARPIPVPDWLERQYEIARLDAPLHLLLLEGRLWAGLLPAALLVAAGVLVALFALLGGMSLLAAIPLKVLLVGGGAALGVRTARRATKEAVARRRLIRKDPRLQDVKDHVRAVKWWNRHVGLLNDYLLQVAHGRLAPTPEVEHTVEKIRQVSTTLTQDGEYLKKTFNHTPLGGIVNDLDGIPSSVSEDLQALSVTLGEAIAGREASNEEKEILDFDSFQPPARRGGAAAVVGRLLRRE